MDFLLGNSLATLEGPLFLILYAIVIFFSITTLGYFKSRLDQTDRLGIPAIPPQLDPFEVAYLRGGSHELARTAIFALRREGVVRINTQDSLISPTRDRVAGNMSEIERTTLDWIGSGRYANEVFNGPDPLVHRLDQAIHAYEHSLSTRQLLVSSEDKEKVLRWKWTAVVVIAILGFYKILAALANDNWNVMFAIVMLAGGTAAALYVGRRKRVTELGDRYLERLRSTFGRILGSDREPASSTPEPATCFAAVDPLVLSVGVFGTAALIGSGYDDYNNTFRKSQQAWGGGCGSGTACGSCSSGGGGSTCSGGSSCSSGCGGGGCGGCS